MLCASSSVVPGLGVERLKAPVIHDQEIDLSEAAADPGAPRRGDFLAGCARCIFCARNHNVPLAGRIAMVRLPSTYRSMLTDSIVNYETELRTGKCLLSLREF